MPRSIAAQLVLAWVAPLSLLRRIIGEAANRDHKAAYNPPSAIATSRGVAANAPTKEKSTARA
jgi:hypothetical protein